MTVRHLQTLLGIAAATIGIVSTTAAGANAAVLTRGTKINTFMECINDGAVLAVGNNAIDGNGWYHATDAVGDAVGGSTYEIYGMSVKETADSIWVALRAGMPLTGNDYINAADGNIGWGDLFLNFSSMDFTTAMSQGKLYGVRFAGTNDSDAPDVGVYSNVTAKSVTDDNSGFYSIEGYNKNVGAKASLGDLPADTSYFDQSQSLNSIASGKFLTSITYLTNNDLVAGGYNLNKFSGSETIAFKFDKSGLNDVASVPEPASVAGLAVIGLTFAGSKLRKRRKLAK